ncbi:MAG: EAL domain-containing protein [Sandaracinaceae bacterium]|nr:MAG: EAL domain-containing protein [Sandaracinaceae bacterium]HBQ10624.1 hypothetical protein [Myxococcales bacterium]
MSEDLRRPCLEHQPDRGDCSVRVPVDVLPFRIGRSRAAQLVLESPRVSKLHAEIAQNGRGLVIRDLDSRNGTFVNGERVEGSRAIQYGDVLHVAHRELTLVLAELAAEDEEETTLGGTRDEAERHLGTRHLYRVLTGRAVTSVFQSIVSLEDQSLIGYEALGRTTLANLDWDATTLFRVAHERGKAEELSRMMRTAALAQASSLPVRGQRVFMNVHPDEMLHGDLLGELERAGEALGGRTLVAEIHEAAIAAPAQMRHLRTELSARGIELAYDDFGAGRSRLMELAEVPPDFLKLDMGLIRGIDASPARQELVAALVKVMRDRGIQVIAEGIETLEEQSTCRALGCNLGQGFLIQYPAAVGDLRETWP